MKSGYAIAAKIMTAGRGRTERIYGRLMAHCNARAIPATDTTGFFGADGVSYPHGAMRLMVLGRLAREQQQIRQMIIADAEAATGAYPDEMVGVA